VTRVKICGVTEIEDARAAALFGAAAIGLNFAKESPRQITFQRAMKIIDALPPFVAAVGLFVDYEDPQALEDLALSIRLDAVQLHGEESPGYCSLISLRQYPVSAFLLDAHSTKGVGGTGETFRWSLAEGADAFGEVVLAGGLNPENVEAAIDALHPFAVDVSTGVEDSPGKKNHELMRRFIEAVHRADSQ